MPAAASNRRWAAGRPAENSLAMPAYWAPWPGKRNAVVGTHLLLARQRRIRRDFLHDLVVQFQLDIFRRHAERVFDGPLAGAAVADDANSVDPQERCTAVLVIIVALDEIL